MNKWYHFKFRFGFPANWWIDIFLIDKLFRDILAKHRDDLELWRFHRRADDDDAGHQLSLLGYTEENISKSIEEIISKHESIKILLDNNLLKENLKVELDARIEATSDGSWPIELQRSWPYFIMGVSEMILDLIGQLKSAEIQIEDKTEISDVKKYYIGLNERLTAVWHNEGSHAFFHHINALFGYIPLIVRPRQVSGFMAIF